MINKNKIFNDLIKEYDFEVAIQDDGKTAKIFISNKELK